MNVSLCITYICHIVHNIIDVSYCPQHYCCIILSTEPHMMVLVLDLMTMKLRDLRRDIHLTTKEHDKLMDRPIISFSVSLTASCL